MASVVADTHALLWMLKGSLRKRSPNAADAVDRALRAKALHVSIGSFLDLRYLVDSGRLSAQVLEEARSIVEGEPFTVVPLDCRSSTRWRRFRGRRSPIPSIASSRRLP